MRSWSAPGLIFARFGRPPGASWAALGRSWGALGRSWPPLGRILGTSLVLLGPSWLPTAAQDGLGLDFSSIWVGFWLHLGASRLVFGKNFDILPPDLHGARISAGNPYRNSLRLFFLPLQRGGTCAAHGIETAKRFDGGRGSCHATAKSSIFDVLNCFELFWAVFCVFRVVSHFRNCFGPFLDVRL